MSYPATVELVNTIPAVVLAGNSVPLKFQASENIVDTPGVKSTILLVWSAVADVNEYFDLLLFKETVRFTCKLAPDSSGTQFHDNSLAATLQNWVSLLANDLNKNYLIARYYDLTVLGNAIEIKAKEEGADYSQEFTAGSGIDCAATETYKTGIDKVIKPFYAIVVLLYCNNQYISELVLNVDSNGLAEVDISDILKAYISVDFKWPESGLDFIFPRTDAVLSWYFRYGERWGNADYKALEISSNYYAISGGLGWMQRANYNVNNTSYWAKLQYNKYFLTWSPLTRYIASTEPVKLYFINHTGATILKLKTKLYTATSDTTVTVEVITSVADKSIHEFVLSPSKVGFAGLADKTLVKVDAWIDDENDNIVSELRTYYLDYTYYEHTRYFIFKNSLGVYDTLRATGAMVKSNDYNREIADIAVTSDYSTKDREELSVRNSEQQKFSLALGWLDRFANSEEYRNWLRDFSLSTEVYQAIGSTLVPVRITSNNLNSIKDKATLIGFSFEFVNAFTDEYFTKEITWNLFDESFSNDFELAQ